MWLWSGVLMNNFNGISPLLNVGQAASYCGISEKHLRDQTRDGAVVSVLLGRSRLWLQSDLDMWIASCRVGVMAGEK
jgi:predicted DNA-binding transcriptional regulator AlpA